MGRAFKRDGPTTVTEKARFCIVAVRAKGTMSVPPSAERRERRPGAAETGQHKWFLVKTISQIYDKRFMTIRPTLFGQFQYTLLSYNKHFYHIHSTSCFTINIFISLFQRLV